MSWGARAPFEFKIDGVGRFLAFVGDAPGAYGSVVRSSDDAASWQSSGPANTSSTLDDPGLKANFPGGYAGMRLANTTNCAFAAGLDYDSVAQTGGSLKRRTGAWWWDSVTPAGAEGLRCVAVFARGNVVIALWVNRVSSTLFIARSVDEGETWTPINAPAASSTADTAAFAICNVGNSIWVSTGGSSSSDIQYSSNLGASWAAPAALDGGANQFDVSPDGTLVHSVGFRSSTLVYRIVRWNANAPTVVNSSTMSSANGRPTSIARNGASMVAVGATELRRSADNGATWVAATHPAPNAAFFDYPKVLSTGAPGGFLLLCRGGLFRTSDSGQTWTNLNAPVPHFNTAGCWAIGMCRLP